MIAEENRIETALRRAHFVFGSIAGAIFHADHGTQYVSEQLAKACKDLGVLQFRAAVGSSADNALAGNEPLDLAADHTCDAALLRDHYEYLAVPKPTAD